MMAVFGVFIAIPVWRPKKARDDTRERVKSYEIFAHLYN
jgi:hypothetical protein